MNTEITLNWLKYSFRLLKATLAAIGFAALVLVVLALTSAPFWIWYNLGKKAAGIHRPPAYIVVMGGGGMPSKSGLMRCWYAAEVARQFPRSQIIIALPGNSADSMSSVGQMKQELVLRGVSPDRILFEEEGTNTRSEAVNISKMLVKTGNKPAKKEPQQPFAGKSAQLVLPALLIVTSPEHLYRSVLSFQKAGFSRVDGVPAFEKTIETNLDFTAKKLGSRSWVPDVGRNMTIRYQFWLHLEYELLVLREYFALAYYKLQGWI